MNPHVIAEYKKYFIDMNKTDPKDAFVIANFARVGKITTTSWSGSQYIVV